MVPGPGRGSQGQQAVGRWETRPYRVTDPAFLGDAGISQAYSIRGSMKAMLTLQRRHSPKCPDRNRGPNYLKCRGRCLLRACGTTDDGQRMRLSLKTRDLQRAARRLIEIEDRMS